MKSMSRLLAITKKEVRQMRRDRLTFGMIVGIPVIQMLLFGYAINTDVRNLRTTGEWPLTRRGGPSSPHRHAALCN